MECVCVAAAAAAATELIESSATCVSYTYIDRPGSHGQPSVTSDKAIIFLSLVHKAIC